MQSWNQWGAPGAYTTPSYQAAPAAPPGAAAATYPMTYPYYGANPGIPTAPDMGGYSTQQWSVVQQQHWQQWQQWQTQFQQWQQQYGDKYQESMSAMGLPMGAGIPPMPPVDMGNPPPLPPADKPPAPPPPPEEGELAKEPPLQDLYRPPVQSGASYGVPPPAIAKPQDDFNKPPPGGYEKPGYRAQEGYQATKRSFDGDTYGRTADPHYPGPEDTKKLRPGGWEENRGGARGGRWGGGDATTPAPAPAPDKPASEPPSTAGRDNPEELSEAEKAFDIQFKQWEDQFNSWKDQNINHPDKSQYREYEAKWESWREQLLQRREQMRKKREQSNASKAAGESEGSQSDRSLSSSRGRSGRRGRGAGAAGYTDLKPQPYTGLKPQPAAPEDYREGGNRLAYGSGYERYPAGQEDPNSRVGGYVEPGLPQPDPNPPFDGAPTKAPESFEEKSKKDESSNSADQASKDPDLKPESTPGSDKAERPLPEQPATPVNVSVEAESKTDETGGNFLKTSSGDGIPGLDLLAEKAGVADKKDQELSVGFDVDDRAKVVEPGSDQPPAGSFTLPPPNISGTGQGTLNLPGMNQVPPNLPEMNQAPQNMQGYGSMYNNAPLNMQGYGSGGKQNIPGFGPPSKQGPPPNMQGYGPGGPYNQGYGQDGNQGPRHMPMFGSGGNQGPQFGSSGGNQGPQFGSSGGNQGPQFGSSGGNQGQQFGPGGNQGPQFGSGGNQGQQFGSGGNQGQQFGSGGNQGPQFGSGGNQGQQFGPGGNQGQQFGSGGNQGQQFGSGGNQGPQFGTGGNQGQQFGPGGNQGPQFGSGGNQGQQFGPGGNQGPQFGSSGGNQGPHNQRFGPKPLLGMDIFGSKNQGFGSTDSDFRHGSGNQGRNFGSNEDIKTNRQDLLSESQRWNVGPGQEMEGQGRRPWEPQENRDRLRGNFGGGRDGFAGSGDNFGASKDNLLGSRDQYGGPRDNFGGPRDNFGGPRDNFGGTRDNFGRQRDNFGGLQDNFGKPKDNFGGPRDNFGNSQENFGVPKDNFGGTRENFGGPRDNLGGSQDKFGGPRDSFGGPRDSFGGPRDNFGGLRDNFGVSRDGFGGPRDSLGAPRDNFRVPKDNFDPIGRDNIARFQDDQSGTRGEDKDGNAPESSAEVPQDFEAPKDDSKDITGPKDVKDPIQRENLQGLHPREGLLGTPKEGLLSTPKEGLLGTPREGLLGTPKEGLLGTPREGLLGTPRDALLGTPRDGLLGTPREGLLGTPREGLLGTPREGLLGTPREGLLGTPRDALLGNPREGLLATPRDNFPLRDNFPGMRGMEGPPFGGDMMRGGHQDFPFHEDNFRGRGGRGGRGVWQDRGRGRPPGPGGHYGKDDTPLPLEDLEGRGNNWGPDGDYKDRWVRRFDDGPPPTRGGWDHPRYPPNFPDRFDNPSRGPPSREEPLGWERGRPRGPPTWEREEEIVLEPATVVDYGHKPVTPVVKADLFEGPVKTFDYGHGSGQRKPPGPEDWRKEESRTRDKDPSRNRWEDRDVGKTRWGRDKERTEEEERWRGRHSGDRGSSRYQGHNNSRGGETDPLPPPPDAPPPPNLAQGVPAVLIDDLLSPPQRAARPARLVIILRGPPGSGKTFVAKLIKDKEVEMGGSAPRILSLDDYFMVEVEKEDKDPETGRKITTKVMEYEYEAAMEKHYQSSLLKAFKKTVNDGYFPFIIVDCINDQVKQFEEMWSYAKQKGFQVYICETDMELAACFKRNIHNRSEEDISKIIKNWEDTPKHYLKTDVRSLLQAEAITEVEMEDTTIEEEMVEEVVAEGEEGEEKVDEPGPEIDEELSKNPFTSKWEWEESAGDKLKRLDGLAKKCKGDAKPQTLEDWLQLTDCYDKRQSTPGKKRVRWADLEERREQEKMRAIGFVVGQTDWTRMTDPTFGQGALTQTKYI